MAKQLKLRRGTTSQHSSFTGAEGEVTVDTTKDTVVVHDGSTAGGIPLAKESAAYTHPNHSGEVTSSADGAQTIADNVVDEANLKVSNSPTNGQFLSAQSGNTGGLTWAAIPAGVGGATGLSLNNNVKLTLGTGSFPTEISYTGSKTLINGDHPIEIQSSNGLELYAANGTQAIAKFMPNTGAYLYGGNGSTRFQTTDVGVIVTGTCQATTFNGSGANLTNLPAANLTGTLPSLNGGNLTNLSAANLTGTLPSLNGGNLTNLSAGNLTGSFQAISGGNITDLNASNLGSGTVPTVRLGSGTANSSKVLFGNNTWGDVSPTSMQMGDYTTTVDTTAKIRMGTGATMGGHTWPDVQVGYCSNFFTPGSWRTHISHGNAIVWEYHHGNNSTTHAYLYRFTWNYGHIWSFIYENTSGHTSSYDVFKILKKDRAKIEWQLDLHTHYQSTIIGDTYTGEDAWHAGSATGTSYGHNDLKYSVIIGAYAMQKGTVNEHNIAVGPFSLLHNTTGSFNTAVGSGACRYNTTGSDNIGIGYNACTGSYSSYMTGSNNIGIGRQTNYLTSTGAGNISMGNYNHYNLTTGNNNTSLGYYAGNGITTGTGNLLLGYQAGQAGSPSGSITTNNNIICLGNGSISSIYCNDTSISSSDKRDKTDITDFTHGLKWVEQLKPVTYRWDKRAWYSDDLSATPDGSKKRTRQHIGFLAQDVLAIEQADGYASKKDDMLVVNMNEDDTAYGLKYERLVPVLVNAIKELSAKVKALEAK